MIKQAILSLDMTMANVKSARAALRQHKTYPADVSFSVTAVANALVCLNCALEDLRDYQQTTGAKP